MSVNPFQKPPFIDWRLDRWKIGVIVFLFALLLFAAIIWPTLTNGEAGDALFPGLPSETSSQPNGSQPNGSQPNGLNATAVPSDEGDVAEAQGVATTSLPLTLASIGPNAVVPVQSLTAMMGTAMPGSWVEVRSEYVPGTSGSDGPVIVIDAERMLGMALVDNDGIWQLVDIAPFVPGQHVISLSQVDDAGHLQDVASPVVVTVLEPGQQGPLSLATPAINFPAVGSRLRSGQITFVGSGLPGLQVHLYLNNRLVAGGLVSTREEWRLTPDSDIGPGTYVARAAALSPQGDNIAESPPVSFTVYDSPSGEIPPASLAAPTLPLQITNLAFGDRYRQTLVLSGLATPESAVSVLVGDIPVQVVNAKIDGGWQMWLAYDADSFGELSVLSSLGEAVTNVSISGPLAVAPPYIPVLLSPQSGDVLTTRRPVLLGLAQPSSEVSVIVDRIVVARVLSDMHGQWAFQLVEPLASGQVALEAYAETRTAQASAPLQPDPVVVIVAPQM